MINARDARPIYEQVRDEMRKLIMSGAIAADEKLPSVRELAANLAINPNTIQRAYRELESMGIIYTVPGKGAFASSGDEAAQARQTELLEQLEETLAELRLLGASVDDVNDIVARVFEGGKDHD
ncbi:MAG: GntR family transcriptional regulator [Coriobacteriales bacterium]